MNKKYEFYFNEKVESIIELIERSEKLYGDSIAIKFKKKKQFYEKSYTDIIRDSKVIANNILSNNLTMGHIAILGSSSYEWIISYFGILYAGCVVVPLDKELPSETISELIEQADVDCLIYDDEYSDVAEMQNGILTISMNEITDNNEINKMSFPKTDKDKLAAILFTSGTTGKNKGVMLTQKNIALNVICGLGAVQLEHNKDVILSVLPLHHAYEFTCTILGMLYKGVTICISGGLKYITRDLKEYKPTVMFVVPLIAEKFYETIWKTARKNKQEGKLKFAIQICRLFNAFGIDISGKLLSQVYSAFGGRLKIIMCGGAPLEENLIKGFKNIGINLFQGYGLTECSPLLTVNFDYYHRPNSVGKIVQYCTAKTVDGEIWAKGLTVSNGYYNMPDATNDAFKDGYFKTGDLGYIDNDGFIFITGRKKNLIILDNGKNVSAEELEAMLYKLPYIKETIVRSLENKIIAEIFLNDELETPTKEAISADIDSINSKLPYYKNIDKFIIRDTEFPKTTTRKIKRY